MNIAGTRTTMALGLGEWCQKQVSTKELANTALKAIEVANRP